MRITTPTLVFLLFCFVKPFVSTAQQGYKPGYIVLTNNDTLSGFLKEQSSRKASQVAVFKKEIKGTKEVYTPDQVKAYRYEEGKYYLSLPVKIKGVLKQVFMEYLIKGKANVYFTHDGDEHYYIQKEGEELVELTEPTVYTEINGKRYASPPKYKNKLGSLLSDAAIQPSIQKTSLEYKSLISLAKEYHEKVCDTEACIVYARRKNKITKNYTVFAGYSVNRYNFSDRFVSDYAGSLQVGVLASFKGIFFSNEKLGFSAGAFFEKDFSTTLKNLDNTWLEVVDYNGERYYMAPRSKLNVDLKVISLRIPLAINYYQPIKKSTLVFGLGASNRITLSRNEDFRILNYVPADEKIIKTYFWGVAALIGYELKVSTSNKITFHIASDHVYQLKTDLSITQFTGRIGFTF